MGDRWRRILTRGPPSTTSDTGPELALRRTLHALGVRYKLGTKIRVKTRTRAITPDLVWVNVKLAVFVDGCFWHQCPDCGRKPKSNDDYWSQKLTANVQRDVEQTQALHAAGWAVLRFWEHELSTREDVVRAAHLVHHYLRMRSSD